MKGITGELSVIAWFGVHLNILIHFVNDNIIPNYVRCQGLPLGTSIWNVSSHTFGIWKRLSTQSLVYDNYNTHIVVILNDHWMCSKPPFWYQIWACSDIFNNRITDCGKSRWCHSHKNQKEEDEKDGKKKGTMC